MDFDNLIERRGSNSYKWDGMELIHGIPKRNGIAMSVADMDFRPPDCVLRAAQEKLDHGIFGYDENVDHYLQSVQWWMKTRHAWDIQTDWVFTTNGVLNGLATCIETYTSPGDGVIIFSPVYHAFTRVITRNNRRVIECPLALLNNRYEMDFDAYDSMLDGSETMLVLCSPHNPGGRVWSQQELEQIALFSKERDLIVVSDEIHHDLVYPGRTHTSAAHIGNGLQKRLIMLTAPSKTFNIAGQCTGNVIIPDQTLREQFTQRFAAMEIIGNSLGLIMTTAAYSLEGAEWLDTLMPYLQGNRDILHQALSETGIATPMPLEATYLSWVAFDPQLLSEEAYANLIEGTAGIAIDKGSVFGKNTQGYFRFNFATQRQNVVEASARLKRVFSSLGSREQWNRKPS